MGYAVKSDFSEWRACTKTDVLGIDETYYEDLPNEAITYAANLQAANETRLEEFGGSLQVIKDNYLEATAQLEQIRDAPSMTQAEAIQAIKYIAKVLLYLLNVLRKMIL